MQSNLSFFPLHSTCFSSKLAEPFVEIFWFFFSTSYGFNFYIEIQEPLWVNFSKWCEVGVEVQIFPNNHPVGFPVVQLVKNLPANAGDTRDTGSILGWGIPPGVGNGNPFQYSCLENTRAEEPGSYSLWGHKELGTTEHARMCPAVAETSVGKTCFP